MHDYEGNKENLTSNISKAIVLKNVNEDILSQLSPRKTDFNSVDSIKKSNDMPWNEIKMNFGKFYDILILVLSIILK